MGAFWKDKGDEPRVVAQCPGLCPPVLFRAESECCRHGPDRVQQYLLHRQWQQPHGKVWDRRGRLRVHQWVAKAQVQLLTHATVRCDADGAACQMASLYAATVQSDATTLLKFTIDPERRRLRELLQRLQLATVTGVPASATAAPATSATS